MLVSNLLTVLAVIAQVIPTSAAVNAPDVASSVKKELTFQDFYLKASKLLGAGKEVQALGDLKQTLALSPDFVPAQYYLAATYLKLGMADKAIEYANATNCSDPRCTEILKSAKELQTMLKDAHSLFDNGDFDSCVLLLKDVLLIAPKASEAFKLRAEAQFARSYHLEGINDLRNVVVQHPEDSKSAARLAIAQYIWLNDRTRAQQVIRRCVQHCDDDENECKWANSQIKKLNKLITGQPAYKVKYSDVKAKVLELQKWVTGSEPADDDDSRDGDLLDDLRHQRCEQLAERGQWERAARVCARVRDTDPEFPPAMLVQAYLDKQAGNSESAAESISHILGGQVDPPLSEKLMQHAQTLYQSIQQERQQKQQQQWQQWQQQQQQQQNRQNNGPAPSPEKDLYAVLDVDKEADTKTIRRAYRELSKKYHPDKYRGGDMTEEEVMAKMQDINEAYETLSNDDKRRDYDATRSGQFGQFGGSNGGGFGGAGNVPPEMQNIILQNFFGGGGSGQRVRFNF